MFRLLVQERSCEPPGGYLERRRRAMWQQHIQTVSNIFSQLHIYLAWSTGFPTNTDMTSARPGIAGACPNTACRRSGDLELQVPCFSQGDSRRTARTRRGAAKAREDRSLAWAFGWPSRKRWRTDHAPARVRSSIVVVVSIVCEGIQEGLSVACCRPPKGAPA